MDRAAELGTQDACIFLPDDANGSAPEHLTEQGRHFTRVSGVMRDAEVREVLEPAVRETVADTTGSSSAQAGV
ncbi:hypothetical protein ACH4TX_32120 [Streptomyces sp. NPDC021098]|uniref:hypothetical protein n=1 Tax=unclassified Streptomyces TaxID=2593676 RepID=UPI003793284A